MGDDLAKENLSLKKIKVFDSDEGSEPVVEVDVTIPSDAMGSVTGDLSSRRGRILGNTTLGSDRIVVHGEAPLAELQDYQSHLKSMTGGAGVYAMTFSRYEAVPPRTQQQLASNREAAAEA